MSDSSILMDADPLLGRVRQFHALGDDRFAIESRYDLEPTLEATQVARDQWPGHYRGTPELGMTLRLEDDYSRPDETAALRKAERASA